MKRLQLPKNKFLRLLINVLLIIFWLTFYELVIHKIVFKIHFFFFPMGYIFDPIPLSIILCFYLLPIFFITRYIWFEKSRNRIFYGLFDKFKTIRKFEPRIYTTSSNADELKKYAELRDQGIITEEEFQSKKKKLLDL